MGGERYLDNADCDPTHIGLWPTFPRIGGMSAPKGKSAIQEIRNKADVGWRPTNVNFGPKRTIEP